MKVFTKTATFLAFITILSSCSKNTINPQPVNLIPKTSPIEPASGIHFSAVTITGNNFDTVKTNNIVQFNGVNALVNSASSTQIIATVPADATTGNITVTTNGKTITFPNFKVLHIVTLGNKFTYKKSVLGRIAFDKNGDLYMSLGGGISKYKDGIFTTIYSVPITANEDDATNLYNVRSFTVDSAGNVYVGLIKTTVISPLDPHQPPTIYTHASVIRITPDGESFIIPHTFLAVYDMIANDIGNIYIADDYAGIVEITSQGKIYGLGEAANINATGLAIDQNSNLYVHDVNTGHIRKIDKNGYVTTIITPYGLDPGYLPMACDKANNLFTIDGENIYITNTAGYSTIFNLPYLNPQSYIPSSIAFDNKDNMNSLTPYALTEYAFK